MFEILFRYENMEQKSERLIQLNSRKRIINILKYTHHIYVSYGVNTS